MAVLAHGAEELCQPRRRKAVSADGDRGACARLTSYGSQRALVHVPQEYLQQAVGGDAEHDQHDRKGGTGE